MNKSIVLFEKWENGQLEKSYSRINSSAKEADKDNILDNAMRELLVKVNMDRENSTIETISITFKEDLKEELQKRGYNV